MAEIGIGIAGYVKHGELEGILEKGFNKTLENYNKSTDAQHAWALVQGEVSVTYNLQLKTNILK